MGFNPSASADAGTSAIAPDATSIPSASAPTASLLAPDQHDIAIISPGSIIGHDPLSLVTALNSVSGDAERESLPTPPAATFDESPANTDDISLELTPPTVGQSANANEAQPPSLTRQSRGRGHRAPSSVWRYLTRDENPHRSTTTICMHCSVVVPHHHKSEKARSHLKRCSAFRSFLAETTSDTLPPDWLNEDTNKRLRRPTTEANANTRVAVPSQFTNTLPSGLKSAKRLKASPSFHPDMDAVADALAMYIYTTGLPFSHFDHPQLRRALRLSLPPASRLRHSASDLSGSLLDRAFASVQCELLRVTQKPGVVNAVCVNSWFAAKELQRNEQPTGLVVVGTAETPLYVDSTPAVAQEDFSNGLFDTLAGALSLCGDNIHGVVTDNSHADQLVWTKFRTIFPSKFFHGCASHGLHLFVGQIFEKTEATEAVTGTPAPFADLHQLMEDCRELVACYSVSATEQLKDQVTKKLNEAGIGKLSMPLRGQWAKLKSGLESVLLVLPLLQELIAAGGFDGSDTHDKHGAARRRIREITCNNELEALLFKAVALVDPLDTLMKRLQVDANVPISEVFYWFAKQLPVAQSRVPGLTEAESAYLLKLNQNRFNAMYGDSHGMAYLLDPRYVGEGLSPEVRKNIEDLVFMTPLSDQVDEIDLHEQKRVVAQQLSEYVVDATQDKASESLRYAELSKNQKTVRQYWQSDGRRWPLLQRVALRLFSLPASTLPMAQRVLDVPLRLPALELAPETRKKLTFIQLNQSLLPTISDSATDYRNDDEAAA